MSECQAIFIITWPEDARRLESLEAHMPQLEELLDMHYHALLMIFGAVARWEATKPWCYSDMISSLLVALRKVNLSCLFIFHTNLDIAVSHSCWHTLADHTCCLISGCFKPDHINCFRAARRSRGWRFASGGLPEALEALAWHSLHSANMFIYIYIYMYVFLHIWQMSQLTSVRPQCRNVFAPELTFCTWTAARMRRKITSRRGVLLKKQFLIQSLLVNQEATGFEVQAWMKQDRECPV